MEISEDIKIMFDGDDKFVIAHVTYEDKFGGQNITKNGSIRSNVQTIDFQS